MYAENKLDEIRARAIYSYSDDFTLSDTVLSGRYICDATDDQDASLRTVAVSVGYDDNGDAALSSAEYDVTLTTMLARRDP